MSAPTSATWCGWPSGVADRCRFCGAVIVRARDIDTREVRVVDPDLDDEGTVEVFEDTTGLRSRRVAVPGQLSLPVRVPGSTRHREHDCRG